MRERLHSYTQRTLGAGGSYNDAVSPSWTIHSYDMDDSQHAIFLVDTSAFFSLLCDPSFYVELNLRLYRWLFLLASLAQHG